MRSVAFVATVIVFASACTGGARGSAPATVTIFALAPSQQFATTVATAVADQAAQPVTAELGPAAVTQERRIPFRPQVVIGIRDIVLETFPAQPVHAEMRLFDDLTLHVDVERVSPPDALGKWLIGELTDGHHGAVILTQLPNGDVFGKIELEDGTVLIIEPVEERAHRVTKVDPSRLPGESPPVMPEESRGFVQPQASGPAAELKVLFVFSKDESYLCTEGVTELLRLELSEIFQSNGQAMTVTASLLCLEESLIGSTIEETLENLSKNPTVTVTRETARADLVTLITGTSEAAGVAYYNFPILTGDVGRGYSVVVADAALANYTLLHEIGHNVGLQHDRYSLGGGDDKHCNYGAFDLNGVTNKRSVMSLGDFCGAVLCPRGPHPVFSHPPNIGTPCTDTVNGADNRSQFMIGIVEASRFFP